MVAVTGERRHHHGGGEFTQPATVVIAGVTAALSSIRCASSRSAAKCCFATASGCRFSLMGDQLAGGVPGNQAGRAMDGDRDQFASAVIDVGDNRANVAQFAAE